MSIQKPLRIVLACVALLAVTSIARANNVFNVNSPNVIYAGAETDLQAPNPLPVTDWLFGTPVISPLDDLQFKKVGTPKPIQFGVTSPTGENFQDGSLQVDLSLTNPAGNSFALMSISEGGDFFLQHATSATTVTAALNIFKVQIKELNGDGQVVSIDIPYTETFARTPGAVPFSLGAGPSGPSSITMSGTSPIASTFTGNWSGNVVFNIAQALADSGNTGKRVTKIELTLDNILEASALPDAFASITKKDFLLSLGTTNPVPEPSSIVLGILGGLGVAVGYRKKFAKQA
jgi:hypothetical protein